MTKFFFLFVFFFLLVCCHLFAVARLSYTALLSFQTKDDRKTIICIKSPAKSINIADQPSHFALLYCYQDLALSI